MGTPHNHAQKGEIAGKVLMPGDPLRAKFIAETYLENPVCFNTVRNMLGYTGTYRGEPVSVMGGGMGMPSIGIYSYELYHMYDVETIIRVGSAGGIQENVNLGDVVVAAGACTDSNYGYQYQMPGTFAPIASFDLAVKAAQLAAEQEIPCHVGNVLSSDIFYNERGSSRQKSPGIADDLGPSVSGRSHESGGTAAGLWKDDRDCTEIMKMLQSY